MYKDMLKLSVVCPLWSDSGLVFAEITSTEYINYLLLTLQKGFAILKLTNFDRSDKREQKEYPHRTFVAYIFVSCKLHRRICQAELFCENSY